MANLDYVTIYFKPLPHESLVRGGECGAGCWPYQRQVNRQILSQLTFPGQWAPTNHVPKRTNATIP
jgi:hypothetical protein